MGAFRRATGQTLNHFEDMTKSLLTFLMGEEGWRLTSKRENVGAWNERRLWHFVSPDGVTVEAQTEATMKGEKADWDRLHKEWQLVKEGKAP